MLPTAVPEKFLDLFLLLSLFNFLSYYSFNFHFYTYYHLAKKTLFLKQISYIYFL